MDNRYDNLARIQRYNGPLLQSHGTNDELIPMAFARRLFDASPTTTKQWLEFPGLDHNSPQPASYYEGLRHFLDILSNPVHHDKTP
jgi:uncharacterized protein